MPRQAQAKGKTARSNDQLGNLPEGHNRLDKDFYAGRMTQKPLWAGAGAIGA